MIDKKLNYSEKRLSVAPMMDWTDRHCRYFHRQLTGKSLLYTEMVTAEALIHGQRTRLLQHDPCEHPLALQLGGSDPERLAAAAAIGEGHGFDEINLNVGCPSDRVQSGTFGACLMQDPGLVGRCVEAMKSAVSVPVTVKCRLGVDHQVPTEALSALAKDVIARGADAIWVHARKAWLNGLSPKENREVPPLDYQEVYRLKDKHPDVFVGINGGIGSIEEIREHLRRVDGVMLGRAAYHTPAILLGLDNWEIERENSPSDRVAVARRMIDYIDRHIADGGNAAHVTRHMLGLFHGYAGARKYRQILTVEARAAKSGDVVERALEALDFGAMEEGIQASNQAAGIASHALISA